jgi:transposase
MIDMLKRHEIQVLRRAGHSLGEVARLTGVARRSVVRVEAEATISHVDNQVERALRGIGRPSKAELFRGFVVEQLAKEPALMSLELLRRVRLQGYGGGKTALYDLIHSIRPKRLRLITRFEGLPGEFSQHDFGQVDVGFLNGTHERIHFFGSRMKYSRWTEVSVVEDERVESLVRAMVDHFARIGGIPLLAVFDRPKTIALHWDRGGVVTEWNPTFASVALDLGLGIELCWPKSPEQKGSVENLVKWVKGSFFKQRRFLDQEDLLRQLQEWHVEVNTQRPSRATDVIPEERMKQERLRLRPLKVAPAELALRIPISVGPTGAVVYDTQTYSMPPDSMGIPGTLYLYRDQVRIVAGRFEALHQRLFGAPAKSTLPEHRAQRVAAAAGKRAKRYMQREHLLEIGGAALEYLTELTHRRPRVWICDVDRLHELLQKHGKEALRSAFERGLAEHAIGAEYIAHYLAARPASRSDRPLQQELPL